MQTARTPQVNRSRRWRFLGLALAPLTLLAGCQTATQTGALAGGVGGAVLGNVIGKATGNRTAGTIVGAGAGTILGAATGNAVDKAEQRGQQQAAAAYAAQQPRVNAPSIREVAEMARSGVSEQLIINQIRSSNARYTLNSQDIIYLQQNGVTSAVIAEMQGTNRPLVRGVAPATVYEVQPVCVAPPPPVTSVGIGYTFHSRGR